MTNKEACKLIEDRMCFGRGVWTEHHHPVIDDYWEAGSMAIKALVAQPKYIEQLRWERDTAIQQLNKLGYGLGKEIRTDTDTISRQAAIDAAKKNTFRLTFAEEQNCEGHVAWSAEAVYSDVMEGALLELPPAQPERKKGRWIKEDSTHETVCSICHGIRRDNRISHINFCNCCGADMRGDNNDE